MELKIEGLDLPRKGLFLCSRTSEREKGVPCDGAFVVQIATKYSPRSGLERIVIEQKWAVEIENIQDFVSEYGECVVGLNDEGFMTIEIYDQRRE